MLFTKNFPMLAEYKVIIKEKSSFAYQLVVMQVDHVNINYVGPQSNNFVKLLITVLVRNRWIFL